MQIIKNTLLLVACTMSSYSLAQQIEATDYRLNYEGRIVKDWANQDVKFNWPGTKLTFGFSGKELSVRMNGQGSHFDVLVDGQLHQVLKTSSVMTTYPLVTFTDTRDVQVDVVKRTETYDAMLTLDALMTEGEITGVWQQRPHILFFGDSFSAGYASESDKRECVWDEVYNTSNARLAFPAKTANMLGTSYTQISYSGLGLVRNWNGNQPYHNLPHYQQKAGAVFHIDQAFEDRYPDLLVVELGTNDFSTEVNAHEPWPSTEAFQQAWVDAYIKFIGQLRERYTDAPVVIMTQYLWPHDRLNQSVELVKQELASRGLDPVHIVQMHAELKGCMWHPVADEHTAIAESLAGYIESNQLLAK